MNTTDLRVRLTVAMALVAGCGGGATDPQAVADGLAARPRPSASPTHGPGPAGVDEPQTWSPTLSHLGTPARGHLQSFLVAGAPPGADVWLIQGDQLGASTIGGYPSAIHEGEVVGQTRVGPDGRAEFKLLVFEPAGYRSQYFEAIAVRDGEAYTTGASELELELVEAVEVLPEASPASDPALLAPGIRFRACIPHARVDRCSVAPEELEPWEVPNVVNYALGDALPIELRAEVCVFETAFPEDCCFGVALWDETTAPDDLCTPWTGEDTGATDWYYGRPFVVGTELREAEVVPGRGWADPGARPIEPDLRDRVVAAWHEVARAEHAAVASFARFTLELLALGAPADLVDRSIAAAADEVRHARLAFDVAGGWGDGPVRPGPLPVDGALGAIDRAAWLVATIRGGCVAETIAAMQVAEAARRTRDPELARSLAAVAEDEIRHAELAWAAVRWCVQADPALAAVARATFAALTAPELPERDPDAERLAAYGVLSARDQAAIAAHVLDRVIRPCAAVVAPC